MNRTEVLQLRLQLRDEVEHLGLDGRVEPGRRLVEDQQRRILRERHRDHDPLLHAAGELERVAAHHRAGVGDLDARERLARHGRCASPRGTPRTVNASATCEPTLIDGFSAAPGFW